MKKIILIILSAVLLSSVSCNSNAIQKKTNLQKSIKQNAVKKISDSKKAAPDFSLKRKNGDQIKLSSLKGKTVVINFFATWCEFCKDEIPGFIKTAAGLKNNSKIVFLFIDVGEDMDTVNTFLKSNNYEVMNPLYDLKGNVSGQYNVNGIPRTLIIDRNGYVVFDHIGFLDEKSLNTEINKQLAKK